MNSWIGEFFEYGHTLKDIENMSYEDYIDVVSAIGNKRRGKKSHNLRPVQKEAIRKAKELEK